MTNKLDIFNQTQIKASIPDIRPGDVVRVFLKLAEKTKAGSQRTQVFEGLVIAKKHGKEPNATFTVRKISLGVGVERVFPLFSPTITKIEVVKRSKVRRAKLYYMRERRGKKARMKTRELLEVKIEEPKEEAPTEVGVPTEVGKKPKEKLSKAKPSEASSKGGEKEAKPKEKKEKKEEKTKKEESR